MKNKEKAFEMMNKLTLARVEALEEFMRGFFRTFERIKPFETLDELTNAVTVMEKVKVFIEYPDHSFSQERDLKKHCWDQLCKVYRAEK